MSELNTLIARVDALPTKDLTDAVRKLVIQEVAVAEYLKPLTEARTNRWAEVLAHVLPVMAPIYDRAKEKSLDLTKMFVERFDSCMAAVVKQLHSEGLAVKLTKNGRIAEPELLQQYESKMRKVFEYDVDAVALNTDHGGDFTYRTAGDWTKLGNDLKKRADERELDAQKKAAGVIDMDKYKSESNDATPNNDAKTSNDAARPAPVLSEIDLLSPEQRAKFIDLLKLAALINQQQRTAADGTAIKGSEMVDKQLQKMDTAFRNLLTQTFFINLDKAFAKAANG